MKIRKLIIVFSFLALLFACQKAADVEEEIVVHLESDNIDLNTKANAVTSIPSTVYWGMTYSNGSGKQSTTTKSVSNGTFSTGYYQTASATTYIHYVSNVNFTAGGNLTTNNGTDVVVGKTSSNSTTPTVALGHIFARTGSLTLNVPSGYSSSGVTWKISGVSSVNGTAGTYNVSSDSWTATSATLGSTDITSSSNMYLIPGTYRFTCSFTLTKGNFSKSYTQSADIYLEKGYVNNIRATTSTDEAVLIKFTTSITAWSSSNTDLEFDGS